MKYIVDVSASVQAIETPMRAVAVDSQDGSTLGSAAIHPKTGYAGIELASPCNRVLVLIHQDFHEWQPKQPVQSGVLFHPAFLEDKLLLCTNAGTTGVTEPNMATTGSTVPDGTATMKVVPLLRPVMTTLKRTREQLEQGGSDRLYVGPGQAYTTIADAMGAAGEGDVIILSPGTWNEPIRTAGKKVSIKAASQNAHDTVIRWSDTFPSERVANLATSTDGLSPLVIEGVTFTADYNKAWKGYLDVNSTCAVIFNKCIFDYSQLQGVSYFNGPSGMEVEYRNCWIRARVLSLDAYHSASIKLSKTKFDHTPEDEKGPSLTLNDTVPTAQDTPGYGTLYGRWLIPL